MAEEQAVPTSPVSSKIFAVMSFVSLALCVYYIYLSVNFIPRAFTLKPKDFNDFPVFSENVWLPLVSAVGFGIAKYVSKQVLTPLVTPFVKD